MTRESLIKHWDVMQAFKDGKKLKVRFGDSFIDDSNPSFGFYEEYIIVEEKEPTKRLPTIEEVEEWFLENKVFVRKDTGVYQRILCIDKRWCEIRNVNIGEAAWRSIKNFCEEYKHLDGSELYITENE